MGYQVNSVTFRLGFSISWVDDWIVSFSYYPYFFQTVFFLRSYLYFFLSVFNFLDLGLFVSDIRIFYCNRRFFIQLFLFDSRFDLFSRHFFSRYIWRFFFFRFSNYLFFCFRRFRSVFRVNYPFRLSRFHEFFFRLCLFVGFICGNLSYFRSLFFCFLSFKDYNLFDLFDFLIFLLWERYRDKSLVYTLYSLKLFFFRFFAFNFNLYSLFVMPVYSLNEGSGVLWRRKWFRENLFFNRVFFFFLGVFLRLYFYFSLYRRVLHVFKFCFFNLFGSFFLFPLSFSFCFVDRYGLSAFYFSYLLASRVSICGTWWDSIRPVRDELFFLQQASFILGFKLQFSGRFTRRQRSVVYWFVSGRVPFSFQSALVDYHFTTVVMRNGVGAVKVWLYRNSFVGSFRFCINDSA